MGTVENWRLSQGGGLPLQLQLISASWGLELKVARSSESFFCFAFFFLLTETVIQMLGWQINLQMKFSPAPVSIKFYWEITKPFCLQGVSLTAAAAELNDCRVRDNRVVRTSHTFYLAPNRQSFLTSGVDLIKPSCGPIAMSIHLACHLGPSEAPLTLAHPFFL